MFDSQDSFHDQMQMVDAPLTSRRYQKMVPKHLVQVHHVSAGISGALQVHRSIVLKRLSVPKSNQTLYSSPPTDIPNVIRFCSSASLRCLTGTRPVVFCCESNYGHHNYQRLKKLKPALEILPFRSQMVLLNAWRQLPECLLVSAWSLCNSLVLDNDTLLGSRGSCRPCIISPERKILSKQT